VTENPGRDRVDVLRLTFGGCRPWQRFRSPRAGLVLLVLKKRRYSAHLTNPVYKIKGCDLDFIG
jgi:hypothetical protein